MSEFTENLSSYTMTQLNELLEDDDKLNKIIEDLEETQNVQKAKEVTLASNRSLAELNLLLQPRLDLRKNQLTKQYRCLQEVFEAYQLRRSTIGINLSGGSLDMLLALLQAEAAKIEEETEIMADLFLDGEQPVDSFIDDYRSKRKLAHLRRVKIDRLREVVLKGRRMPRAPAPAPATPAQPALTPSPAAQPNPEADSSSSPMPVTSPTQPAALPGYPYPPCPYSSVSSHTGYDTPFPSQASPALPEALAPPPGPQPGFILQ
ncbi:hypothetical protein GJAV_G00042030 [Gymnothorax javanicus]|nr:hypothetical protein GJAV_G00042030 [Gymnothorax javanicus]